MSAIVFTDDDEETLNLYRLLMKRARIPAFFTSNGSDALYYCQVESVALVVSDINKPQMNGLDLLLALRSDPQTEHIPVIFVTASLNVYTARYNLGYPVDADDYLEKPFNVNHLMDKIEGLLPTH